MFFFFPIGHDQPIYERPWLTISLIALCTLILVITATMDSAAEGDLELAVRDMTLVLDTYPGARVSFEVEGLPEALEPEIRPLIDTTPGRRLTEGDLALEAALRRVFGALNDMPTFAWGFRPARPDLGRGIAHMFLHAGFFHLLGNMLLLWVAGGVLECFWRRWAYLLLYFGSGFVGLLWHVLSDPTSMTPVVGASGAVAGLLGAFLVGYPRTKIRFVYAGLFFRFFAGKIDLAAWVVLPLWAGLELFDALLDEGSGVAHWAHVGGFLCGAITAFVAKKMLWVAEDAGISRAPRDLGEPPAPPAPLAPAPSSNEDLPLPPSRIDGAAPASPPSSSTASRPGARPAASMRPLPEAIELSSLPPPEDDDLLR